MDNKKIKEIVRKVIGNDVKKKDPKKELKEFQKAHESLAGAVININRINSTFASNLSREEHIFLRKLITKLESDTAKFEVFVDNLKL